MPRTKKASQQRATDEPSLAVLFESFALATVSVDAVDAFLHGHDLSGASSRSNPHSLISDVAFSVRRRERRVGCARRRSDAN
jgi:hypothetical protein